MFAPGVARNSSGAPGIVNGVAVTTRESIAPALVIGVIRKA
ncbi:unannotated protein [freshwater metagenome]|uniref:Unannotated protein n=1 Tax=freshwater metagenome TaxID=449393 RepID=A0A6J6M6K3_9ZZZZ